jgi:uncharacterized Zn ribbon protein
MISTRAKRRKPWHNPYFQLCPHCDQYGTFERKPGHLKCPHCGHASEYTEYEMNVIRQKEQCHRTRYARHTGTSYQCCWACRTTKSVIPYGRIRLRSEMRYARKHGWWHDGRVLICPACVKKAQRCWMRRRWKKGAQR